MSCATTANSPIPPPSPPHSYLPIFPLYPVRQQSPLAITHLYKHDNKQTANKIRNLTSQDSHLQLHEKRLCPYKQRSYITFMSLHTLTPTRKRVKLLC